MIQMRAATIWMIWVGKDCCNLLFNLLNKKIIGDLKYFCTHSWYCIRYTRNTDVQQYFCEPFVHILPNKPAILSLLVTETKLELSLILSQPLTIVRQEFDPPRRLFPGTGHLALSSWANGATARSGPKIATALIQQRDTARNCTITCCITLLYRARMPAPHYASSAVIHVSWLCTPFRNKQNMQLGGKPPCTRRSQPQQDKSIRYTISTRKMASP